MPKHASSTNRVAMQLRGALAAVLLLLLALVAARAQEPAQESGQEPGQAQGLAEGEGEGPDDNCECVPYYQCSGEGNIIQDGSGLIDVRVQGPCDHYLDVCCKTPGGATPPPVQRQQTGVCGQRNPEGVAGLRITGDTAGEAQFGEFPWMVAVLRTPRQVEDEPDNAGAGSYVCGGALVHPQVAITAAHCVASVPQGQLVVRAGEWDSQTTREPRPSQDRRVAKVVLHPQFRADSLYNDLALLTLDSPVDLMEHVGVVCLPQQDAVFDHSRCFASGWGKDVFGKEGRYQVILKKVEQPVVPRAECIERLRKTRLGAFFQLHESFVCAGGEEGQDTCQGDGGSPLMCPTAGDPNRYQQVGIVAWGIGCGGITPAVYTNVALFRDWIDQQFLYSNLNATSYTA